MEAALDDRSADCPKCQLELTYQRGASGSLTLICTNAACGGSWPAHQIIGDADAQLLTAIIEELGDRYAETDDRTTRIAERAFAHVIVDEGQDISAMQWRAIMRRCPTRSLTVVLVLSVFIRVRRISQRPRVGKVQLCWRKNASVWRARISSISISVQGVVPARRRSMRILIL